MRGCLSTLAAVGTRRLLGSELGPGRRLYLTVENISSLLLHTGKILLPAAARKGPSIAALGARAIMLVGCARPGSFKVKHVLGLAIALWHWARYVHHGRSKAIMNLSAFVHADRAVMRHGDPS